MEHTRSLSFAHQDIVGTPTVNFVGNEGGTYRQANFQIALRDFRDLTTEDEIDKVSNSDVLRGRNFVVTINGQYDRGPIQPICEASQLADLDSFVENIGFRMSNFVNKRMSYKEDGANRWMLKLINITFIENLGERGSGCADGFKDCDVLCYGLTPAKLRHIGLKEMSTPDGSNNCFLACVLFWDDYIHGKVKFWEDVQYPEERYQELRAF